MIVLPSIHLHSCHAFAFSTQLIKTRSDNVLRDHSTKRDHHHLHTRQHLEFGNTILRGHDLDSFNERDDNDDNNVISVTIRRTLPDATPYEARNAWIEYHWNKGGGLPIFILSKKPDDPEIDHGDDGQIMQDLERTILPIFMKEKVEHDKSSIDAKSIDLHYTVTEAGPFFSDLIPGSHSAVVTFDGTNTESSGCVMTWNVTFSTTRWSSFYEAVTKRTVGIAATTVQEASSTPRLFSMTTTIDSSHAIDPVFARKECLEFLFAEGGGLPLLPPIPFGDVLSEGGGSARQNLLRIPPLITESIIDTKTPDGMADFTYLLNDPGWGTFPFLLHTHIGRVRFTTDTAASDLIIDWDVEIRPYKFASPIMEKLAETTVSTVLRNLRVRLTEPDAVVVVKPPRGNDNLLTTGQTSLGTVAKQTWLGGVLDAHLSDTRSTMEQTTSLFQPWTWGRSGTGDEDDCLQFQWTDGHKITS